MVPVTSILHLQGENLKVGLGHAVGSVGIDGNTTVTPDVLWDLFFAVQFDVIGSILSLTSTEMLDHRCNPTFCLKT